MNTKLFEVRGNGTCYFLMATLMVGTERKQKILERAGYYGCERVLVTDIQSKKSSIDPFYWNNEDIEKAHLYIAEHFQEIQDNQVLDLMYLAGETATPRDSMVY